jgi:hypothetical protein
VSPGCDDVAFWVNQGGYGDDWEETLTMDVSNLGSGAGGTMTFSLRYDAECAYDYVYLEYLDTGGAWNILFDQFGVPGVFNGVSDNGADVTTNDCDNGMGSDGNYFDDGTHVGSVPYHGNSAWYSFVTFPIPAQSNLQIRFRASSDKSWSDQDGRGDTDGLAAIDNVILKFNNGDMVTDDFEFGSFAFALVNGIPDASFWQLGDGGNTYDGWHLAFDPMYKNKGATCTFSDEWMWEAKPDPGPIPEDGFRFLLVSPQIPVGGWTGGVLSYTEYLCADPNREDRANQLVRYFDSALGLWSPWADADGLTLEGGCTGWDLDACVDLTPFLGADIETLQVAFELCDVSSPLDFSWGKHSAVNYLVDNVSVGSFSSTASVFAFARSDLFHDTFSLSDPAHAAYLDNDEQGQWIGGRTLEPEEMLSIRVSDVDGLSTHVNGGSAGPPAGGPARVDLFWRSAGGPWNSKLMSYEIAMGAAGEGIYRVTIGDDGGVLPEDQTSGSDGLIWTAGQLVEYYLKVVDDGSAVSTLPAGAGSGAYFEFQVLPFLRDNGFGEHLLVVNDYGWGLLDFPSSTGYLNPGFSNPVCDEPSDLLADALETIYDPLSTNPDPVYDVYHVLSADSNVQTEPRGLSDPALGLGGFMDENGLPIYDAIFWVNGDHVCRSFEFDTRVALMSYLDNAGNLLASGDNIAHHLGAGGCDADAVLAFVTEYLGAELPTALDDGTSSSVLDVQGVSGLILNGYTYGIYGDCPKKRRFDRLTLSVPSNPMVVNEVIMEYAGGGAADNGRAAVILCDQDASVPKNHHAAVLMGFDLSAFRVNSARADLLNEVITNCFGLAETGYEVVGNRGEVGTPGSLAPLAFQLSRPAPNPAVGAAEVRFTVGRTGPVRLDVYDVLGRQVRNLTDGVREPETYVVRWDGNDERGRRVGSGVYFYRLSAPGFEQVRKMTLLR